MIRSERNQSVTLHLTLKDKTRLRELAKSLSMSVSALAAQLIHKGMECLSHAPAGE